MGAELRVDQVLRRRDGALAEDDGAAAADAVTERAQAVGRGRAVPGEAAALATGGRLGPGVQRAAKVPSRCSSAFESFCPAGSEELGVVPADCAYG